MEAWTFDELYGRDGKFLNSLEELGEKYVGEIPANFHGWVEQPTVRKRPQRPGKEGRIRGRRHRPRVVKSRPSCEVANLASYSLIFRLKSWQRYRIKDTHRGPEVWEVKWGTFWRKTPDGLPTKPHCLIVARNVLTKEVKYFISNQLPGQNGVTLRRLLQIAFGRCQIEACFRQAKEELGMDHYEVRGWRCVHRHFYLTQLSQLFCARVRQELDQPTDDGFHVISVEQVRSAINVYLQSIDLPPAARHKAYQKEIDKQNYYQKRNAHARESHHKTRVEELLAIGIDPDKIKSCIPKNLGGSPPS